MAFNSSNEISIANNGADPIYVIGLTVETEVPKETKYFGVGLDIASGKIEKFHVGDGMPKVKALHRFGTTWEEHYQKALTLYQSCGIQLTFFSPTDPGFLEIKRVISHRTIPQLGPLAYLEIPGKFRYRVQGSTDIKEQIVPIVAVTAVDDKCPNYY